MEVTPRPALDKLRRLQAERAPAPAEAASAEPPPVPEPPSSAPSALDKLRQLQGQTTPTATPPADSVRAATYAARERGEITTDDYLGAVRESGVSAADRDLGAAYEEIARAPEGREREDATRAYQDLQARRAAPDVLDRLERALDPSGNVPRPTFRGPTVARDNTAARDGQAEAGSPFARGDVGTLRRYADDDTLPEHYRADARRAIPKVELERAQAEAGLTGRFVEGAQNLARGVAEVVPSLSDAGAAMTEFGGTLGHLPPVLRREIARQMREGNDDLRATLDDRLGIDDTLSRGGGQQLMRALGSSVPYVATGLATGGSSAAVMALGAAQGAGQGYREADAKRDAGEADDMDVLLGTVLRGGVGALEGVPISRGLGRAFKAANRASGGAVQRTVGQVLRESGEEGAQEWVSAQLADAAARMSYDPDRPFALHLEDALLSAAAGGITGGAFAVGGEVGRRRSATREAEGGAAGQGDGAADAAPELAVRIEDGPAPQELPELQDVPAEAAPGVLPLAPNGGGPAPAVASDPVQGDGAVGPAVLAEPVTVGEAAAPSPDVAATPVFGAEASPAPNPVEAAATTAPDAAAEAAPAAERAEGEPFEAYVERAAPALREASDREVYGGDARPEAGTEAEALVEAAQTSENPATVLRGWRAAREAEAARLDPTADADAAIAEHLPFVSSAEAGEFGDLSGAQRRAFFRAPRDEQGKARPSLAEAAAVVSAESGIGVTAEQVAAFVRAYPGGASSYRAEVRRPRRHIETRLREITGEPVSAQRVERYLDALDAPPPGTPAPLPAAPGDNGPSYGTRNVLVTADRYRDALATLGRVAPFSNPQADPAVWRAAGEVAAFHAEALAREGVDAAQEFADFSARMVRDLGRDFEPHVRALYDAARERVGAVDVPPAQTAPPTPPAAAAARGADVPQDARGDGARTPAPPEPPAAPAGAESLAPPSGDGAATDPPTVEAAAVAASALTPTAPPSAAGAGPAVVALNRAETARAREVLGLDRLPPAQRRSWSEVLDRAERDGLVEEAPALASAVLAGEVGPLRDVEHAALVLAAARLTVRHRALVDETAAAVEAGDATRAATARRAVRAALDQLDRIQRAADLAGRETARALSIRQLRLDAETFEPAAVLRAAAARKGEPLTDREHDDLGAKAERVRSLDARVRRAEDQAEGRQTERDRDAAERAVRAAAERYARAADRAATSRRGHERRAERLDELARERAEIRAELARLGLRANDVFGLTGDAAVLVGRLALNLAESGAVRFADIVAGVREVLPDVTERQVAEALAAAESRRQGKAPKAPAEPESLEKIRVEREVAKKDVRRSVAALDRDGRLARFFGQVLGAPRTLMATADVSAALRQGFILSARHPGRATRAFGKSLKAAVSSFEAEWLDLALKSDPRQAAREAAGLYLAPLGAGAALAEREEAFQSPWLERVPVLGSVLRASERHYVTHLNLLRASAFDFFLDAYPDATRDQLTAWARYVNAASGRGSLGDVGQTAQNVGSALFFSPRFLASRWQALIWEPARSARTPAVRKEIAKTYAAFAGVLAVGHVLWGLAFGDDDEPGGGGATGLDPRDSDFLKMVTGNLRVDAGAGTTQVVRLLFQMGLTATDAWGLTDPPATARETDAYELNARYLRYKLAPAPSAALALSTRKDAVGEDVTPAEVAVRSLLPLGVTQTAEAYGAGGADVALAVYLGNFWGISVDVYDDPLQRLPVKRLLRRAEYRALPGDADEAAFKDEFARRVIGRRTVLGALSDGELKDELAAIAAESRTAAAFVTTGDPLGSPDVLDLLTRADYTPGANPPDDVAEGEREGYGRAFAERFAEAVRAERGGLDEYRDPEALKERLGEIASDARTLTRAEATGDPLAPDLDLFLGAGYRPSASPPRSMPDADRDAYAADWRRRLAARVAAERDLLGAYGRDRDGLKARLRWHAAQARAAARAAAGY